VDVRSLDAFKAYLRQDASAFPDSTHTLRYVVAEGDLLALWITCVATQRGQMVPFPPSGKTMQLDSGIMLRIERGRIAEMWATWDNLAALAQFGHVPPQKE
jgi:predicted ester cyclase